ncbi:chitin synthase 1 [Amia ocellicauda]|uniref:chitin synthase 1 n=1 Tax=Amia ocellicauda TaxID=2972642 RepID=UPI0034638C86
MEELKNRAQKREGRHRDTWDPFQLNPIGAEKEEKRRCFILVQHLVAVIVGLMVLVCGVISKSSLLVLTILASPKSLNKGTDREFYILMLAVSLVVPNVLVFLKSLWKCAFKNFVPPNMRTMGLICLIETLVSLGMSLLVIVVMPQFDILTNLFISGSICFFPSLFQVVFRLQQDSWKIIFPLCSVILVLAGYLMLGVDFFVRSSSYVATDETSYYLYVGIAILASMLISLNWWENAFQASTNIKEMLTELDSFRDFVFIITSLLRIIVIGAVFAINITLDGTEWSYFNDVKFYVLDLGIKLFILQAFSSALCHWFGVVAVKIHSIKCSFALPLLFIVPSVLFTAVAIFLTEFSEMKDSAHKEDFNFTTFCQYLPHTNPINTTESMIAEICNSICRTTLHSYYELWPIGVTGVEGLSWWIAMLCSTYYVWSLKVQRIERTSQIFVRRLYESAFVDQSLLLNTKMRVVKARNQESTDEVEECVIYLCATMWHETYDEMLKILTSMFRLDRYRGDPKEDHKDNFDFECHIFVDDAFHSKDGTKFVNEYVDDLVKVIIEVYRVFTNKEPDDMSITETPYGGRLTFVLPEGNMLYIHLKDKQLIRNKKRWSQIMYMYYLLGWKGYIAKNPKNIKRHDNPCRASLISLDGECFLLPAQNNDDKRRNISDDNVYVMALDGDTDFHPSALILLVDRLRMYHNVGAACGRIHPTGMGPMVWYQKFEYAVGHWLQKTAEHVFGSVLCSPGCFSLFRGSAIMDDNVIKRYTTTATKAGEYVQYDQGEDRWLCTLLLQQGWRVEYNAASDAYTNAPEEFKEFYNQRRRWGPSTLANTLDLLHSGRETAKKNSSISMLYIFYQIFTVGSSILGPASVCLMIAGAFSFVFKMDGTLAIILSVIPPVVYLIICFITKPDFQISVAAVLSVMYAFLMTASFFSIIGDMVKEQTFITPTGIFLVSMSILYLVTAILHPQEFSLIIYGLMYVLCIPSGYLLLTIYSLVNMHVVSWGTRESNRDKEQGKAVGVLCDRNCKMCCWDVKIQVTQETENLMLQQIQQAVQPNTKPVQKPSVPAHNPQDHTVTAKHNADHNSQDHKQVALPTPNMLHKRASLKNKPAATEKEEIEMECISSGSEEDKKTYEETEDEDEDESDMEEIEEFEVKPNSEWVDPVKQEFLKKLTYANLKRNLQEQIRYALRNKNQEDICEELVMMLTDTVNGELNDKIGPEDILTDSLLEELQYSLNETARRTLKSNRKERLEKRVKRAIEKTLTAPQVERLTDDEHDFWMKLIERYLTPLKDDKINKDEVKRELKSLRNKATFLYFIANTLWVVATFFLQAIGNTISIKMPKIYPNGTKSDEFLNVEPLSLMFLLSFAVLLLVQFLAMLYHRVYTLIHMVSYRSTEKDYVSSEEDEDGLTFENQFGNGLVMTSDDM